MVVPLSLCQLQSYYMVKHKLMYMLELNIPLQNFLILNSSKRPGFDLWIKKIPWIKEWQPTPVFLPEESHGQKSLAGYSPWDHKESNTTEQLTLSLLTFLPAFVLLCPNSHFGLPTWWSFVLVPYCSKGFREICFRVAWLFSFTLAAEVYPSDKTDMFPSPYKQATHRRRSLSASPAEDSGNLYHLLPSPGGIRELWLLSPHSVLCQEGGPLASIRLLFPHGTGLFPTHQSSKTGKVPLLGTTADRLQAGCKVCLFPPPGTSWEVGFFICLSVLS